VIESGKLDTRQHSFESLLLMTKAPRWTVIERDHPQLDFVRECLLLARKWRSYSDGRLREAGMTQARATVLYWLDVSPEVLTQRQLAVIVGIEGPTLVRQLNALEAKGLIERVPVPGDRRANGIRLTAAAEPIVRTVHDLTNVISDESFKPRQAPPRERDATCQTRTRSFRLAGTGSGRQVPGRKVLPVRRLLASSGSSQSAFQPVFLSD
jgi:MarR family transcriptional regulator for hemolysin